MEAAVQVRPVEQNQLLGGGSDEAHLRFNMWKQTLMLLSRHSDGWCCGNASKIAIVIKNKSTSTSQDFLVQLPRDQSDS